MWDSRLIEFLLWNIWPNFSNWPLVIILGEATLFKRSLEFSTGWTRRDCFFLKKNFDLSPPSWPISAADWNFCLAMTHSFIWVMTGVSIIGMHVDKRDPFNFWLGSLISFDRDLSSAAMPLTTAEGIFLWAWVPPLRSDFFDLDIFDFVVLFLEFTDESFLSGLYVKIDEPILEYPFGVNCNFFIVVASEPIDFTRLWLYM